MVMIRIVRLKPGAEMLPDIPGERVTINLHELPPNIQTLQGAIDYAIEHSELLPPKFVRLLELYRGKPIVPKPH